MTLSHKDARALVATAFISQFGRQGTLTELQCLQAIGWLETNYGSSWHGPGVGSFNMGAIQKGGWSGSFFEYTDTHPNSDGTSTPYQIGFRKYTSPQAGFEDLCKVVYMAFDTRRAALACAGRGDLFGFSTALHKYPCYYEGFGATDAVRIAHHVAAVTNAIQLACKEIGDPMPAVQAAPTVLVPALMLGCKGPAVGVWQHFLGVREDDDFGGETQTSTRAWQQNHGLPATGVVQESDLKVAGLA